MLEPLKSVTWQLQNYVMSLLMNGNTSTTGNWAVVAQPVRTWAGSQRVHSSSPHWTKYGKLSGQYVSWALPSCLCARHWTHQTVLGASLWCNRAITLTALHNCMCVSQSDPRRWQPSGGSSRCQKFSPFFYVVGPALSLTTTPASAFNGALQDGFGKAIMTCQMSKPRKLATFNCYEQRFPRAHLFLNDTWHIHVYCM